MIYDEEGRDFTPDELRDDELSDDEDEEDETDLRDEMDRNYP